VVWGPATDATSLVDGYSFAFSANPSWTCDTTKDVEEGTTSATSPSLGDGGWYFHICAVDNAGNWGPVTSGGPYVVEAVSPTVGHVGSVADSGDGAVTVDEEIDAPITQLLLTFNEAMADPAGHTTPGDVSNPASYRLVGDGGDGVIATTTCTVDPSDTSRVIDHVVYDAATATAGLYTDGGFALPLGSYALFACASEGLADLSGNLLDGDGNGTGGDDFAVAFSVVGTSLLANPNLDDDVSGWVFDGPATTGLAHSTEDADDAPSSGSLHLSGSAAADDVLSVTQCIALTVPGSHRVGGRVRVASSTPGAPVASVALTLYSDTACTAGNELNLGSSAATAGDTGGWTDLDEVTVWSGTALSAAVVYTVTTDQPVDVDVNLDRLGLWLEDSPLSADGFEAGGTQNWTGTQVGP
jgi:hypothetical protein